MPGFVSAEEIHAIRDNLLYEQYKNVAEDVQTLQDEYTYVTYEEVLDFIKEAAEYSARISFSFL